MATAPQSEPKTLPPTLLVLRAVRELSLSFSQKAVLTQLILRGKWGGQGFTCFPSLDTLARDCSCAPRTITACLAALVGAQFVGRAPRGRMSTLYKLDVVKILRLAEEIIIARAIIPLGQTDGINPGDSLSSFGEVPGSGSFFTYRVVAPLPSSTPTMTPTPTPPQVDNTDFLDTPSMSGVNTYFDGEDLTRFMDDGDLDMENFNG